MIRDITADEHIIMETFNFLFSGVFNVETCLVFVALMAHTHCMGPDRDRESNLDGHNTYRKQWFPVTVPVLV